MQSENVCPICKCRVSDMAMATGQAQIVECFVVHKKCQEEFKLRHGVDWTRYVSESHGG
jgi:hypothetical protein